MSKSIEYDILGDPSELISLCLACPKDTCNNCVAYKQPSEYNLHKVHPPKGVDLDMFIGLYNAGLKTADLARALNTTPVAIKRFMVRSQLPERQKNRPLVTRKYWEEK